MARPPAEAAVDIFGFPDFLVSLALLVLVYNTTDSIYRFRIETAPLPLRFVIFAALIFTGAGALLTGLWFSERWYAPAWGVTRGELEALFGAVVFVTAFLWMWYAFLRPPIFGKRTYKFFAPAVFRAIVRGSDSELPAVAAEIGRSAGSLVRACAVGPPSRHVQPVKPRPVSEIAGYAHDILLMLGNRKFCRHVVASAPITAIVLMQEAAQQPQRRAPLGQFARNVTTEAILNGDSALYHEDDTYTSGLLGHIQPFTRAMFGNWRLIEDLGSGGPSPLDLDWRVSWELTAEQFQAYCRITLMTFRNYVEGDHYRTHSYALHRAFEIIEGGGRELYKLNGAPSEAFSGDIEKRFSAAVRFVDDAIKILETKADIDLGRLRSDSRSVGINDGIFDRLAELMYDLMRAASSVKAPPDQAWWIQYNAFWSAFFSFRDQTPVWRVIRFKFFRRVFDEIKRLEDLPNFQSSKILGMSLNILGLSGRLGGHRGEYDALTKAVLGWTKRNYLRLCAVHPPVAEDCLSGGITYDAKNKRLVKTYSQGLNLKPSQEFLQLDEPSDPAPVKPHRGLNQRPRRQRG
jgi:hypothetical protein